MASYNIPKFTYRERVASRGLNPSGSEFMEKVNEVINKNVEVLDELADVQHSKGEEIQVARNRSDIDFTMDALRYKANAGEVSNMFSQIDNQLHATVKTINGKTPVNGNINISMGDGTGTIDAEDMIDDEVFVEPTEVRNLVSIPGTNSFKLIWEDSVTVGVTGYNIYLNGTNKVGSTEGNSFNLTGAEPGYTYAMTVKAITPQGESAGKRISSKCLGNTALNFTANNQYVKVNDMTFDMVELDCIVNPTPESWGNVLLSQAGDERLISSQFAGETDWFNDGYWWRENEVYINDVPSAKGNNGNFVLQKNTRYNLKFEWTENYMNNLDMIIFANGFHQSTLKGKLYGLKFYKMQENGELGLIGAYDLTSRNLNDLLGKSPSLQIVGATFG